MIDIAKVTAVLCTLYQIEGLLSEQEHKKVTEIKELCFEFLLDKANYEKETPGQQIILAKWQEMTNKVQELMEGKE